MTDKEDTNNEDKKNIEDEEREKMLNEENNKKDTTLELEIDAIKEDIKDKLDEVNIEDEKEKEDKEKETEVVKTGEVEKMKKQLEESEKENRGKIRVPIGGIKIPGFLRSRSRDKNKEGDATGEEGTDLLEQGGTETSGKEETKEPPRSFFTGRIPKIKFTNPFNKKQKDQPSEKLENQDDSPDEQKENQEEPITEGKRQSLIESIKRPLVAVLPKTFIRQNKEDKEKDVEAGAAGLASMETLEDSKEGEDGMVTVQLNDKIDNLEKDPEKAELAAKEEAEQKQRKPLAVFLERALNLSRHEKIIAGVILLLVLFIIIILLSTSGPSYPPSPPVINGKITAVTSCGPVEGLEEEGAFVFRGIPYTLPPTGARRWKPSESLNKLESCWNGTFLAHNKSNACWQQFINGSIDGVEDCLSLDVYTPSVRYDNPLPVVVLIGSETLSGGSPGIMTPSLKLVKSKDVLFVRPNFRLGVLGFLAADVLSAGTHPPSSGNYGLSDILTVLKWVQLNIVHFGGDKDTVTLLGHRAGATLVTALTSSSLAKGLFKRAWVSSGSAIYPGSPLQLSEKANKEYVNKVCLDNDKQLGCLREVDAEDLMETVSEDWKPHIVELPRTYEDNTTQHEWLVLDGNILKQHVWGSDLLQTKLVIGTTAHSEASPNLWEVLQRDEDSLEVAIAKYVRGSHLSQLGLAEEALRRYNSTWQGLAAMVSDIRTVCPLLVLSQTQQNISFYVLTLERNFTDFGPIADVDADISAILGHYQPTSPVQKKYVSKIQDLFYKYVTTGEFNNKKQRGILNIKDEVVWQNDYPNCDFWISKDVVPRFARRD